MALVLARFLFGFLLSLACVSLLAVATWISIRAIALAIRRFPTQRSQDVAGGLGVSAVVILTIAAMYACGHLLYRTLGDSPLAGSAPHWLAGSDNLSAAAILGVLAGLGGLAYAPALWRRLRTPRAERAAEASAKAGPAARSEKAAVKPAAKPAGRSDAKARAKTPPPPKGPRIPQLGWAALFLLAIGAALLAFAFIIAPPAGTAANALAHAARARPVYLAAGGLLAAGALCLLTWLLWRRPAPEPPARKSTRASG